jgi:hypothetical protein
VNLEHRELDILCRNKRPRAVLTKPDRSCTVTVMSRSRPLALRSAAIATLALSASVVDAAAERGAATCDRLRAEARSEAALLYAPRIQIEGARSPGVLLVDDPSAADADGLQARLALALSPVDMLRGRAVERVADAECRRERLIAELDRVLSLGTRHGELAAARTELDYLDRHAGEVDALVDEVMTRFERQRATALEVDELRARRAALRRRIAELRHTHAVLAEIDGEPAAPVAVDELAAELAAATLRVDRRRADLRALEAWRFDVRAGVAGAERADWFAVVELGYSFGAPWQRSADRRAIRARAAELADDERGATVRLTRLQAAMRHSVAALEVELQAIDDELAALRGELARIAPLDSDAVRPLRARITVALIELEARRAATATLIAARRPLAGGAL